MTTSQQSSDVTVSRYTGSTFLVEVQHIEHSLMKLEVGENTRKYKLKFVATMNDEKQVWLLQVYGATRSESLCTLCNTNPIEAAM